MKIFSYVILVATITLFFFGLYYWLAIWQMDYAAFFMALSAIGYGLYLHITKANKAK
jgi:hypothetical protein